MRLPIRSFATLALGIGVATCSDAPIATVRTGSTPASRLGVGRLAVRPEFSRTAAAVYSQLAAAGVNYDNVHVAVRDPLDTTKIVKDTIVSFSASQDSLPVDMTVPVTADGQRFDAGLDYRNGQQTLFSGHLVVQSYRPGDAPPPTPPLVLNYTGPGANAAHIAISPHGAGANANSSVAFTVSATDAGGSQVTVPPIAWSVSDASLASVSADGVVSGKGRRGTVALTAAFGTITDQVSVTFTLPPTRIILASGSGQTGKAGATLAAQAVVQVLASDNAGVVGVNVIFSAPAGGSVTPTSTTTDVNGRASATLKLGSAVGPQSFAATAVGFSVGIPETATPADASTISVVSGGTQSDTVRKTLAPLTVKVADAFGNPVSGATVSWTRTSGTGALGAASTTTNADGQATNTYTLGSTSGNEVVAASVNGVTTPATFAFTAVAGGPAAIAVVSGSGQAGRVSEALANQLVVAVTDVGGNAVSNAPVTWTATNGTITAGTTTGADGQSANTFTLGRTLGAASAKASIANGQSVTFSATADVGVVAQIAFSAQPANAVANALMTPVRVALRDAGGNATSAVNPVTIAIGTNANGATLSGTLTRNAVAGVATFDDLKLDKTGNGYTLVATSGSLPPATSQAFSIAPASAAVITIVSGDNQIATVNTAVTHAPSVRVADANGNPIPGVAVTFTPSAGAVSPTTTVSTDAQGVATLTSWTLGTIAGAQSIVASVAGVPGVTLNATANAGNAFKLHITSAIPASATSGVALAPQPVVQVTDQFGNAVPAAASMNITAAPTNTSITISGQSATANTTSGVTNFATLTLTGSGTTRIVFNEGSGSIKPDTSAVISVTSSGATQLVLDPVPTAPISFAAGSVPALPRIKTLDVAGAAVGNVPVHIAVTLNGLAVGAADLSTDSNGELVAPSTLIPTVAGTYVVTATSSAIAGVSRAITLNVSAGTASRLVFTSAPTAVTAGTPFNAVVEVRDAFNNRAIASTASVSLTLTPIGEASASLGTAASVQSGLASFTGLTVTRAASGYTMTANSSDGLTATTSSFGVVAAAPSKYVVSASTTTPITGSNATIIATMADAYDNPIGITTAPNWTINPGGVGSLSGSSVNGSGQATITYTAPASPGGSAIITATNATIPSAVGSVTLTPVALGGLATTMTIQSGVSSQTAVVNTTVPNAPAVLIKDGNNNPVVGMTVTFAPSGNGTVSPASGIVATNAQGIASLTSWKLGTTAGAQSLTVSAAGLASQTINATATAGAPTSLSFTSQPANTTAGAPFGVTVGAVDSFGNAASLGGNVSLSLNPPGGASTSLGSPSAGAFTGLSITKAATGYTITATATGLTSATSSAFNVAASSPARYVVTSTTATPAISSSNTTITAALLDQFENAISTPSPRTVNWSIGSGGVGSVGAATSTTNAAGQATITYAAPSSAGGTATVIATDATVPTVTGSVVLTPISLIGAPATITVQSGVNAQIGTVDSNIGTAPSVLITDAHSNPVPGVSVTFAPATGNGSVVPLNGVVQTNAQGIATLTSWKLGRVAGPQSLTVSVSGLPSQTISATARAGAAATLNFASVPSGTSAGTAFNVSVSLLDAFGNITDATNTVTLTTTPATMIRGTSTVAAVNGVATFSSLSVDVANTYTFTAAASGLPSVVSGNFSVSTGGVHSIAFVTNHGPPSSIDNDASFGNGPQIIALDAGGNPVAGVTIDASIDVPATTNTAPGPNADMFAAFAGLPSFYSNGNLISTISQTTGSSGIADFTGARIRGLVQSFRLKFTVRGATISPLSGNLGLHHGAATNAICTATLPAVVRPGHTMSAAPKFNVTDVSGNVVDNTTLSLETSAGGTLGGTSVTTDASGNITGPAWTVGANEGTHTVGVHGMAEKCGVAAAKPHHVKLTGMPTTMKNGAQFPSIDTEVQDSLGRAIEDETFTLTMSTVAGPGTHTFQLTGNSRKSSNGHGKSTFDGVGVDADAQTGAKVVFTADGLGVSGSASLDITSGTAINSISAVGSTDVKVRSPSLVTSNLPKVSVRDFNGRNTLSLEGIDITWVFKSCEAFSFSSVAVTQTMITKTDKSGQATGPSFIVPSAWVNKSCTLEAQAAGASSAIFTIHNP